MGIDYYSCKSCSKTFPDVMDFMYCDCGYKWCCQECADKDGHIIPTIIDEDGDEVEGEPSCRYCRGDYVNEEKLYKFALKLLNMTNDELIQKYKEDTTNGL